MQLADKRIVVTGGAGFLGQYVVRELIEQGASATDIAVPRRQQYDLTQQRHVEWMFARWHPEVIIHLAAEVGGIGANQARPGRFCYANLAMGLNLIEQARWEGVEKFVQVGTTCSYPESCPVPFREKNLWRGYPEPTNAPYGIAKRALLALIQSYRAEYGFNGIYLIPANLYGPGDNFDPETSHVIPALIRRFCEAVTSGEHHATLWGTGEPTREFLFADDAARAIVNATRLYDKGEPVNLGTGDSISIKALAELIAGLVGFKGAIKWDESKPNGQMRRQLDIDRAHAEFGFFAETKLADGLRRTIDWRQTSQ